MAGRRLIDAAKLFNASRAIGRQHIALRSNQIDIYTRTSTLAKATKEQTDRVTLTLKAAIALAQRFNEPDSTHSPAEAHDYENKQDEEVSTKETATQSSFRVERKEGIRQDHHYEHSEENSATEPRPDADLGIRQESSDRRPFPDGSIPSIGSNIRLSQSDQESFSQRPSPEPAKEPLAEVQRHGEEELRPIEANTSTIPTPRARPHLAGEARRSQCQSESQIPSIAADAQSGPESLARGYDSDVFYDRPTNLSPGCSPIPKTKIPKTSETAQGARSGLKDEDINSDVFSLRPKMQQTAIDEMDVPEGVNVDIFRTGRVSDMLGSQLRKGRKKPHTTDLKRPPFVDWSKGAVQGVPKSSQVAAAEPQESITSQLDPVIESPGMRESSVHVQQLAPNAMQDADAAASSPPEKQRRSLPS